MVENEMTEGEVDEIFGGYHSSKYEEERHSNPRDAKALLRPSSFTKSYVKKEDAIEGDYFVEVFLDYFGRVVGKNIGEYCH